MHRHQFALLMLVAIAWPSLTSAEEVALPPVRAVAFSADGKLLAAATGEPKKQGQLAVWDADKRKIYFRKEVPGGLSSLAFGAEPGILAIGGYDKTARIINVERNLELCVLKHPDVVRSVGFSADGNLLVTAGSDNVVRVWNHDEKKEIATFVAPKRLFEVAISPDAKSIVGAADQGAYHWEMNTAKVKNILMHDVFVVRRALFSPDGRWIVTGGFDGFISIWNARESTLRYQFRNFGSSGGMAYCPKADLLVACSFRKINLVRHPFDEPSAEVRRRVDTLLLKLSDDAISIREAAVKELLTIGKVAESLLKTAAKDSSSAEVRMRSRKLREHLLSQADASINCNETEIDSLAISPDGKCVAGGGRDGFVYIWDVATLKQVDRLQPGTGK